MNPRERLLATVVLGIVCVTGAGVLFYQFLLVPLQAQEASIASLSEEIQKKRERIAEVLAEKPKLDWWQHLSLPADMDLARRDYEKYLSKLLSESGFAQLKVSVTPRSSDSRSVPTIPGKGPIYNRLTFTVEAHGELLNVVQFLQGFYRAGQLQQIRNFTVQRPTTLSPGQGPRELDMNLTVEALIVSGTKNGEELFPGVDNRLAMMEMVAAMSQAPWGLGLAAWTSAGPAGPLGRRALAEPKRTYLAIAGKDIFFGQDAGGPGGPGTGRPGEVLDFTRFVYLTDIEQYDRYTEAFLYDRYNNKWTRLRASAGFDSFRYLDSKGEVLARGTVVRIDDREVILRVDSNCYALHVGQNIDEALRKPLLTSQMRELKLSPGGP